MKARSKVFFGATEQNVDNFINNGPGVVKNVAIVNVGSGQVLVTVLYEPVEKDFFPL